MTSTYDLRLGDDDAECKWGGAVRSSSSGATCGADMQNAVASTRPVHDLQRDLQRVGIRLRPQAPNGVFDEATAWSVREFQIYARMSRVAKEDTTSSATVYVERLSGVATGAARYGGPISGVFDAATRAAMTHWLAQSWRCPLVLEAWKSPKKGAPPARVLENVWVARDASFEGCSVRARDLSEYYRPQPATDRWRIGRQAPSRYGTGPAGSGANADAACEVLPDTTMGKPWAQLGAAERSTFKVTRAVAEVECIAFFDVANAYDPAIISMGIFHFAMLPSGAGELAALLHRLANEHASDYERCIRFFGVDVAPAPKAVARFKFSDETGAFPEPDLAGKSKEEQKRKAAAWRNRLEYLRSWHWFYRIVMMARTTPPFWRLQWRLALERLAEIRSLPIDAALVPPVAPATTPPGLATIGDVFTSERATALVLRWDVNRPSDIRRTKLDGTKPVPTAGPSIVGIIEKAKADAPDLDWTAHCSAWTDAHEAALLAAIRTIPKTAAQAEIGRTLPLIDSFPNVDAAWTMDRKAVGELSERRGTFSLAAAPAPAPPPPQPPAPAGPSPSAPPPGPPPALPDAPP